jgi:hypothetical protein
MRDLIELHTIAGEVMETTHTAATDWHRVAASSAEAATADSTVAAIHHRKEAEALLGAVQAHRHFSGEEPLSAAEGLLVAGIIAARAAGDLSGPGELRGQPAPGEETAPAPVFARMQSYCADAPSRVVGESDWNDQESAHEDGKRIEQSEAADIMRGVLAAIGLDAPAGVAICSGCSREVGDGHDSDCTAARWWLRICAPSIQVTAAGQSQAERYALSDLGDSTLEWNVHVAEAGPSDAHEEEHTGDWELEEVEAGTPGEESLWTFNGVRELIVIAESEAEAERRAVAMLAAEQCTVTLTDPPAEPEDEPCPINRRPKGTCPAGCDHGEG